VEKTIKSKKRYRTMYKKHRAFVPTPKDSVYL